MPIHDGEIRVTVEQVRRLVATQCPQWADLPVTPLPDEVEGTDHVLFARMAEHGRRTVRAVIAELV